jgi:hypothetical protein
MRAELRRANGCVYRGSLPDADVYPDLVRWAGTLYVLQHGWFNRTGAIYAEATVVDDFDCDQDDPTLHKSVEQEKP